MVPAIDEHNTNIDSSSSRVASCRFHAAFTLAGNTEFNALIHMPPSGDRAGDIVLVDSTHFTTLFGASDSLKSFWRNLVTMA